MHNNGFASTINAWREGLATVTNGHGAGPYAELVNNITSLRRGILDMVNDQRRNLDADCGWPATSAITAESMRDLFDRDSIANRVVNLMPKECWQVTPEVYEKEKGSVQTPFEKSWKALNESVAGKSWHGGDKATIVFEKLKRLDILSGIGSFGVMLIGLDDGKRLDEPAEGVVARVEGGIAFNSERRLVDTWMTEDEEKHLQGLKGKGVKGPLSNNEKESLRRWRKQREQIGRAVQIVANERIANAKPDDGEGNPRSPKSMFSNVPDANEASQQWFGTQFGAPEALAEEPNGAKRKVTFLRVFDEASVQVTRWEASMLSPRFGQPVMYRIQFNDPRDQSASSFGMPSSTAFVHWSRVLHVASDKVVGEAVGNSRLKPVVNEILNLRKVRGSGAEGYYQSCFPTLAFETHPQLGPDVDVDLAAMRGQVENLINSLQRSVIGIGGAWKTLPPSVVDPTPHLTAGIEAICIQLGCPVRIFKGSERGELASSQDDSQWNDRIGERQNGHVTPYIIVPFIDRLILMGALEPPEAAPSEEGEEGPVVQDEDGETGQPLEDYGESFDSGDILGNVFCPTGDGGGIDATCGGGGSGGATAWDGEGNPIQPKAQQKGKFFKQKFMANGETFEMAAEDMDSHWEVEFQDSKKRTSLTGKHGSGAISVMRAAGATLDSFVKDKSPKKFIFSASVDEPSRVSLYNKAMGLIAKRHGYSVSTNKRFDAIQYTFVKGKATQNSRKPSVSYRQEFDTLVGNRRKRRMIWNAETNTIEPEPLGDQEQPSPDFFDEQGEEPMDEETTETEDEEPGYKVEWPDLDSLGDMDRASIASTLTQALSAYVQSGAADMMPLEIYLTVVWQMDDAEVQSIVTAMEKHQEEVQLDQQMQQQQMMDEQGMQLAAPEGMIDPEQRDMDHEVAMAAAENPAGAAKPPGGGFPPKKGPPTTNEDGQWITTDDGNHLFLKDGNLRTGPSGKPLKGTAGHTKKVSKATARLEKTKATLAKHKADLKLAKANLRLATKAARDKLKAKPAKKDVKKVDKAIKQLTDEEADAILKASGVGKTLGGQTGKATYEHSKQLKSGGGLWGRISSLLGNAATQPEDRLIGAIAQHIDEVEEEYGRKLTDDEMDDIIDELLPDWDEEDDADEDEEEKAFYATH